MNRKGATQMTAIALALSAFLAAPSYAQQTPVHYLPEPDFESIIHRTIEPLKPKDAFGGLEECAVADARTLVPVTLAKAQEMLGPCVDALSRRYGFPLALERMAAGAEKTITVQIEGLVLYVPEAAPLTGPLLKDLHHALNLRQGRVLGHPMSIRRGAAPSPNKLPEVAPKSAAQAALDRCVQIMVLREIHTSEDFLKYYGRCLLEAQELAILQMGPTPGQRLTVTMLSAGDEKLVRSLTGEVSVIGANGPVSVSVIAYPRVVALP